jgi:hypothetical protein
MAGFKALQSFQQWHYPRAAFYSARNSPFITDEWLSFLAAHNNTRYDQLARIDIRGCNLITIGGIVQFVETMGSRLKGISMSHFHERQIQDTDMDAFSKLEALLGSSPCLESLTLEINIAWINAFSRSPHFLNNSTSLRELSIIMDWYADIPAILPNLETLKLEIIDGLVEHYWKQLGSVAYPRLKRLEMTVSSHSVPHLRLGIGLLMRALKYNKNLHGLESLIIRRSDRHHAMDRGFGRRKWPNPKRAAGFRRSISVEREEWRELNAFCQARNIYCKYPLSLDI